MPKSITIDALKKYLRTASAEFLDRPNITSVGIGYKIKDGRPTKELSLQFTVARKVAPEDVESIGAKILPKTIVVNGIAVPTDVIERSFEVHLRVVRPEAKPARKSAVDPIVPGVSIAHRAETAGTAGAVVYDARTGEPYVLSNWHVLNGDTGRIGDAITQPGSFDDDRVERNVAGHLVRSHLGPAGDCAIAKIEGRQLDPKILELDVAVEKIGEAELGDKVVKSGRTTAVTYGIVARVHVTVRLDYGAAGKKDIGCFEIHPDPARPARDRQISMGGDSGAAWMAVERGKATNVMVGLHFAGETGDEPDHAMACYAASVFEKLEIVPARPSEGTVRERSSLGFAPAFTGSTVALPKPATVAVRGDLVSAGGRTVFDYTHFSLAMSRSRRFARWVAWNVDGSAVRRLSRDGLSFVKDPNVPAEFQVGDELYSNNPLDRGHIARRQDLLWGTEAEAVRANKDSFFFTNITPQHRAFNQSGAHGIWGELENAVFEDTDVADLRISVIGGPVLQADDRVYRGVKLPREFYKILYYREAGQAAMKAKGYVLTQKDLINELEALELPEFAVFEVPIAEIGRRTGLSLQTVRAARRRSPQAVETERIRRVASVREIVP